MKSTGIVRKVDELGRVVIPMETRRMLGIGEKDPLEIFVDGSMIVLQKYAPGCEMCDSTEVSFEVEDHKFCDQCAQKISSEYLQSQTGIKKAAQ